MGCKFSQPEGGMMPGTKPEAIWSGTAGRTGKARIKARAVENFIGQHQKGADGKTYIIYSYCCYCCVTYQELSDAVKPTERFGRFLQKGQLTHQSFLSEVKEAQKKMRQFAEDDGIDIPYECIEYGTQGTGLLMNRI